MTPFNFSEYTLFMSKECGEEKEIAFSPLEQELSELVVRISKAFVVANYRGNVQFYIRKGIVFLVRTYDITYTDDVPTGICQIRTEKTG
jgi:hypothetical protein